MQWREFRQEGRKHDLAWYVAVKDNVVYIEHGVLGGKLQQTDDVKSGVNIGKSNEKSPEQVAQEYAERQILLKRRSGYVEYVDGQRTEEIRGLTWGPLPLELRFWKPDNQLSKTLLKKLELGEAWPTRKRNGMAYPLLIDEWGDAQLYSRVMHPAHKDEPGVSWNERFAHLVAGASSMVRRTGVPPRTLFLGELVASKDIDNFNYVQQVTKSLTDRAIRLQVENGLLWYYVWDIAFWGGEPICATQPVRRRYSVIHELFHDVERFLPIDIWMPDEVQAMKKAWDAETADEALREEAKAQDFEGWVIVDPDATMGDRAWNLRGKTDRPGKVAGKNKPHYEDDMVALWDPESEEGTWGHGKRKNSVGSVALYQYNEDMELVYICNCGGGIKERGKDKKASDDAPFLDVLEDTQNYPLVVKVLYDSRNYIRDGDDTNALSFPRMVRIRTDKDPEECQNPYL